MARTKGLAALQGQAKAAAHVSEEGLTAAVDASLGAALGPYAQRLVTALEDNARGAIPFDVNASADGTTVSVEGTTYLVVRAPFTVPTSDIWEVRSIRVGMGTGPFTAAQAGTAYFFSTGGQTFAGWKDTALTLPALAFYSSGQFPIYGGHRLSVLVGNYTAGQNYTFSASLVAFPAKDYRPTTTDI